MRTRIHNRNKPERWYSFIVKNRGRENKKRYRGIPQGIVDQDKTLSQVDWMVRRDKDLLDKTKVTTI